MRATLPRMLAVAAVVFFGLGQGESLWHAQHSPNNSARPAALAPKPVVAAKDAKARRPRIYRIPQMCAVPDPPRWLLHYSRILRHRVGRHMHRVQVAPSPCFVAIGEVSYVLVAPDVSSDGIVTTPDGPMTALESICEAGCFPDDILFVDPEAWFQQSPDRIDKVPD